MGRSRSTGSVYGMIWWVGSLLAVVGICLIVLSAPEASGLIVAAVGGIVALVYVARDMRHDPWATPAWTKLATTLFVLLLSTVGAGMIPDYYTVSRIAMVLLVIVCLVALRMRPLRAVARDRSLSVFALLAFASAVWSPVPASTLALAGYLSATILVGGVLAVAGPIRFVVRHVAVVLAAISIASLGLLAAAPDLATSSIGRFAGLFAWNSDLGLAAAVGFTAAVATAFTSHRPLAWYAVAGLQLGVLAMAQSATSIAAAAAAGVMLVLFAPRTAISWFWRTMLALVAVGGIVWQFGQGAASPLDALGKDSTLTGRTDIWAVLQIAQPPTWLGTGAGGFWSDPNRVTPITTVLGFNPGHPHNGYLQALQDLGWIGLAFIAASIVVTFVLVCRTRGTERAVLIAVLTLFLVANIANSYLLTPHLQLALYAFVATRARLRSDQAQSDEGRVDALGGGRNARLLRNRSRAIEADTVGRAS